MLSPAFPRACYPCLVPSWGAGLLVTYGMKGLSRLASACPVHRFKSAFQLLLDKGCGAKQIRDAVLDQDIELVLAARILTASWPPTLRQLAACALSA